MANTGGAKMACRPGPWGPWRRVWPAALWWATVVVAKPVTLIGDPVDYAFEADKACCIDVAAVNLLNYLDRQPGLGKLVADGRSIADQQAAFHRRWDPTETKSAGTRFDLKNALAATFKARDFAADIQLTETKDLGYAQLLAAWNAKGLVILLANEVDLLWGHALFLWGLEDDASKPRLAAVDPNLHPNTHQPIEGRDTGSTGAAVWSDLAIGVDAQQKPDWRITLQAPDYTYTVGQDEWLYEGKTYKFRISEFVVVSNVRDLPEPASLALAALALVASASARQWARRQG